jgi:hypothetical protein
MVGIIQVLRPFLRVLGIYKERLTSDKNIRSILSSGFKQKRTPVRFLPENPSDLR